VVAIGSPFGLGYTVTAGVLSAKGRGGLGMNTVEDYLQTDASINPGNSGGPLLNINGELIGINVALREGAQGIAFAINADTVKMMLSRHLSAVKIGGIYHGLNCDEKVLGETGPRQRVVLAAVDSGAPAAGAGLKMGDEILTVAHRNVGNRFDVERALWDKRPGEKVALQVLRQGQALTLTLTLSPAQENGPLAASPESPRIQSTPDGSKLTADRP